MSTSGTKDILDRLIKAAEVMEPNAREEFLRGPVAKQGAAYAREQQSQIENQIGALLMMAIANARPLPPEVPLRPEDYQFGVEVAEVLRDLDRGRGPPWTGSRAVDWREAIRRLGDFAAAVEPGLRWAVGYALSVKNDDPMVFGRGVLKFVSDRWADHANVTWERIALGYKDTLVHRMQSSSGGKAKRAPTRPRCTLSAAHPTRLAHRSGRPHAPTPASKAAHVDVAAASRAPERARQSAPIVPPGEPY